MRRYHRPMLVVGLIAVVLTLASSVPVSAQVYGNYNNALPQTGDFGIGTLISNMTGPNGWVSILSNLATHIFVAVAVIEFVWMIILSFISGRSIGELMGAWLPKMIAFSLFFYFLVLHGVDTAQVIITSFTTAAGATPDGSTGQHYAASPTGLMSEGFNLTWPMMIYAIVFAAIPNFFSGFFFSFGITNMQVPVIFIQMFGATLTIGAYVFLGGTLLITIVEAYLVSVFGLLMAGLSPLRTTHAFGTQKAIGYAISVGVKLLTLYLIIGLIQTVIAPIIAAAAAIPIAGALTVGFYGIILALIAYNVPTFASTIVSGIASGNAAAGVSAMTAAVGSATAMAQSMHGISEGIHDRNEAKQMGSDVQDRQSRSEHVTGGGKNENVGTNKSVATDLSKETLPSAGQQAHSTQGSASNTVSSTPSMPQSANATSTSNAANQGVQNADSSNGAKSGETQHHGVRGLLDKAGSEVKQLASEMKSGQPVSPAAGNASPGQGNAPSQNAGKSDSKQTQSAYEKFKQVDDDPNATADQKNAAANTFWSAQSKEITDSKKELHDSIDSLGKGFANILTPSGGASSGAVAGATLRSSV